jgi:hypothetical protein
MAKISVKRRKFQIRKKQKRKAKLKKLRQLFNQAKSQKEKEEILERIKKIAPQVCSKDLSAWLKE